MAKCGYCGSTIIMGGVSAGTQRFCNRKCAANAQILTFAQQVPRDVLEREAEQLFHGNCPKCRGPGPLEVHKVHQVWSALLLTRWTTNAQLSCRPCAAKSQLGGILFSAVCGWWGFPWGLILTPVQITRNIAGLCASEPTQPSEALRKLVLVHLGTQILQKKQQQTPPPLPKG